MSVEGTDCVFCEIVAGRSPAHRVFENDNALVILDIQPLAEGHCLVLSKRHVPFWHALSPDETRSLFEAAHAAANTMVRRFDPDFVCLYARGRRIPHTHLLLVPTSSGDVLDRFFNTLERFQESPAELAALRHPEALSAAARALSDDT